MSRLSTLSSNPTLRNFAKDASQKAIRRVAQFIAPLVPVPDVTGQYKVYNAENRYKRPNTKKVPGQNATVLGFEADDPTFTLRPHALDFPIPNINGMSEETLMFHAQYGVQLLADASGLDHEAETIEKMLASVGAGTDYDFTSDAVDPIELLDQALEDVQLLAKNGAALKILFGKRAVRRARHNKNVKARFTTGSKGGIISPTLADIIGMLSSEVKADVSQMVIDTAAPGVAEDIDFILGDQILIFASNDEPNTMDASFMKTLVPARGWMVPGSYQTQDERDQVLKMDWTMQILTTNAPAAIRINAKDS